MGLGLQYETTDSQSNVITNANTNYADGMNFKDTSSFMTAYLDYMNKEFTFTCWATLSAQIYSGFFTIYVITTSLVLESYNF